MGPWLSLATYSQRGPATRMICHRRNKTQLVLKDLRLLLMLINQTCSQNPSLFQSTQVDHDQQPQETSCDCLVLLAKLRGRFQEIYSTFSQQRKAHEAETLNKILKIRAEYQIQIQDQAQTIKQLMKTTIDLVAVRGELQKEFDALLTLKTFEINELKTLLKSCQLAQFRTHQYCMDPHTDLFNSSGQINCFGSKRNIKLSPPQSGRANLQEYGQQTRPSLDPINFYRHKMFIKRIPRIQGRAPKQ